MPTGIVYGSTSGRSRIVAEKIAAALGPTRVDLCANVRRVSAVTLRSLDVLIAGTPTYELGSLHEDWASRLAELAPGDLSAVRFAVFGLGDQQGFAHCFVDAMGLLYRQLALLGARGRYGFMSTNGFAFEQSQALIDGKFCGLALDEDCQASLTDARIEAWCRQLIAELDLPA